MLTKLLLVVALVATATTALSDQQSYFVPRYIESAPAPEAPTGFEPVYLDPVDYQNIVQKQFAAARQKRLEEAQAQQPTVLAQQSSTVSVSMTPREEAAAAAQQTEQRAVTELARQLVEKREAASNPTPIQFGQTVAEKLSLAAASEAVQQVSMSQVAFTQESVADLRASIVTIASENQQATLGDSFDLNLVFTELETSARARQRELKNQLDDVAAKSAEVKQLADEIKAAAENLPLALKKAADEDGQVRLRKNKIEADLHALEDERTTIVQLMEAEDPAIVNAAATERNVREYEAEYGATAPEDDAQNPEPTAFLEEASIIVTSASEEMAMRESESILNLLLQVKNAAMTSPDIRLVKKAAHDALSAAVKEHPSSGTILKLGVSAVDHSNDKDTLIRKLEPLVVQTKKKFVAAKVNVQKSTIAKVTSTVNAKLHKLGAPPAASTQQKALDVVQQQILTVSAGKSTKGLSLVPDVEPGQSEEYYQQFLAELDSMDKALEALLIRLTPQQISENLGIPEIKPVPVVPLGGGGTDDEDDGQIVDVFSNVDDAEAASPVDQLNAAAQQEENQVAKVQEMLKQYQDQLASIEKDLADAQARAALNKKRADDISEYIAHEDRLVALDDEISALQSQKAQIDDLLKLSFDTQADLIAQQEGGPARLELLGRMQDILDALSAKIGEDYEAAKRQSLEYAALLSNVKDDYDKVKSQLDAAP